VELARRGATFGAVGLTVDHERAHAADALAAVVIERDGLLARADQVFVHDVEHLEEALIGRDALCLIGLEVAVVGGLLTPHLEGQIEKLFTGG
jgi:hypothetical protein